MSSAGTNRRLKLHIMERDGDGSVVSLHIVSITAPQPSNSPQLLYIITTGMHFSIHLSDGGEMLNSSSNIRIKGEASRHDCIAYLN